MKQTEAKIAVATSRMGRFIATILLSYVVFDAQPDLRTASAPIVARHVGAC
jgi:hypothetical protein